MILVTGFMPFGGHAANPSEALVRRLEGLPGIAAAVLPVAWDEVETAIAGLIARHRPAAVLSFGLSASADRILVERVALNLDDAHLPDAAGEVRRGCPIAPDGPAAYWSGLPVDRMVDALAGAAIPAAASAHAGTYVCNHLFYTLRHRHPALPAGFVHVPPEAPGPDVALLERAAHLLIEVAREAAGR